MWKRAEPFGACKVLLERLVCSSYLLDLMMAFVGHSGVRSAYEELLTQFLVFCASSALLSGPACLFITLLTQKFLGLDLALVRIGCAATPYLISLEWPPTTIPLLWTWNRGTM